MSKQHAEFRLDGFCVAHKRAPCIDAKEISAALFGIHQRIAPSNASEIGVTQHLSSFKEENGAYVGYLGAKIAWES